MTKFSRRSIQYCLRKVASRQTNRLIHTDKHKALHNLLNGRIKCRLPLSRFSQRRLQRVGANKQRSLELSCALFTTKMSSVQRVMERKPVPYSRSRYATTPRTLSLMARAAIMLIDSKHHGSRQDMCSSQRRFCRPNGCAEQQAASALCPCRKVWV